jgi:hypothetical protein
LEALSIFCMFAAVAVVKYAVQPQAPAAVFIISSADAELAVLSLCLGGGSMGREVGDGVRFGHEFKLGPTGARGRSINHSEAAIGIH